MNLAFDSLYTSAKPFVKWVGGKGQLLATFRNYYPVELVTGKSKRYVEPFVGGGAVFFDVMSKYTIREAVIIDINSDLINTYKVVRDKLVGLIDLLDFMEREYLALNIEERIIKYYEVRDKFNSRLADSTITDIEKAGLFIFLNKTCFNGLYRVNRSGHFNVPVGKYTNPTICDSGNLKAVSEILQKVNILCGDFHSAASFIDSDSFVYFDPPYRPLNITSNFTSYSKQDFNDTDQTKLASFYKQMDETGAYLMLSNSDPHNSDINDDFFEVLYRGYQINKVFANRAINSKASKRGAISEILVTNYRD